MNWSILVVLSRCEFSYIVSLGTSSVKSLSIWLVSVLPRTLGMNGGVTRLSSSASQSMSEKKACALIWSMLSRSSGSRLSRPRRMSAALDEKP